MPKSQTSLKDKKVILVSWLAERFEFRKNIVSGFIEFKFIAPDPMLPGEPFEGNKWLVISDGIEIQIWNQYLASGREEISFAEFSRQLKGDDISPRFDPLVEYAANLPEWDGHDYIKDLADTVTIDECDQCVEDWYNDLKKWLVATMVTFGGLSRHVNQTTLVLIDPEGGTGKSKWGELLMPPELQDYVNAGDFDIKDKDARIMLARCALIPMDEIDQYTKTDISRLKSYTTTPKITERLPFEKNRSQLRRVASFYGTTNRLDFIGDEANSRRFICYSINSINYQHNVDMRLVFTQCYHLFKSGFEYWYSGDSRLKLLESNEKFKSESVIYSLISDRFSMPDASKGDYYFNSAERLSSTDIAVRLAVNGIRVDNKVVAEIGRVMGKLGFEQKKVKVSGCTLRKWLLVDKQSNNIPQSEPPF